LDARVLRLRENRKLLISWKRWEQSFVSYIAGIMKINY